MPSQRVFGVYRTDLDIGVRLDFDAVGHRVHIDVAVGVLLEVCGVDVAHRAAFGQHHAVRLGRRNDEFLRRLDRGARYGVGHIFVEQFLDLVAVARVGQRRLPFYGADVLVEARFQLDTAVIDLAGVGVGIGVTRRRGNLVLEELVVGVGVVVGEFETQLVVEHAQLRTDLERFGKLRLEVRSGSETVGADVLVLQRNVGVGQVGRRGIAHAGVRAADFPIVEDLVLRNQLREDQRCTDRRIDRRHGGRAGQRREPVRADRRIDVNEIPEAYLHRSVDGLRLLADVFTGHFGRRVRHVDVADVEEVGKTQQVAALSHHVVFFVVEAGADVGRQAEIVAELLVDVEQYVGVERVIGHLLLAVVAFRLAEQSRRRCVEFTLVVGVGMVHADTARKVDPVGDLPLERAADDIAVLRGVEHVAVGDPIGVLAQGVESRIAVGPIHRGEVAA